VGPCAAGLLAPYGSVRPRSQLLADEVTLGSIFKEVFSSRGGGRGVGVGGEGGREGGGGCPGGSASTRGLPRGGSAGGSLAVGVDGAFRFGAARLMSMRSSCCCG